MAGFADIFTDLISSGSKRKKLFDQGLLDESDLTEAEKKKWVTKKPKKPIMKNPIMKNPTSAKSSGKLEKALIRS